jgi:hypothetical protein
MKTETRLKVGPVALLVLLASLALLVLLAVHRKGLTANEAEDEVVGTVVKAEDLVVRDKYVAVAVLALMALFAFVMWTALRANQGDDKAMRPARELSTNDKTTLR